MANTTKTDVVRAQVKELIAGCKLLSRTDLESRLEDAVVVALTEANQLRNALLRARGWGIGHRDWSATVALDLADWIDAGCEGPLPELPGHLQPAEVPQS